MPVGPSGFPAAFTGISIRFRPHRHLMTASGCRTETTVRFAVRGRPAGVTGRPAEA